MLGRPHSLALSKQQMLEQGVNYNVRKVTCTVTDFYIECRLQKRYNMDKQSNRDIESGKEGPWCVMH